MGMEGGSQCADGAATGVICTRSWWAGEPSGTSLPISVSTSGIALALVLEVGTGESENPRMSCPGGSSWGDPRRGSLRLRNGG